MANRIADILAADGDTDSADLRRSKAIGILAQPAYALHLLTGHAEPAPTYPRDPESDDDHVSVSLANPFGIDHRKLRPTVVLHVHLTHRALRGDDDGGCARVEGVGPVTLGQVQRFLADSGCRVRIQPVMDPADVAPIDSYEIPQRLRDAALLRNPADIFPWGTATSRGQDLDHSVPYDPLRRSSSPPQTNLGNLGPLSRDHHRAKTHGGWRLRQPDPGTYLWRSPHGWTFLCTNAGTLSLGRTEFARAVWTAARPVVLAA